MGRLKKLLIPAGAILAGIAGLTYGHLHGEMNWGIAGAICLVGGLVVLTNSIVRRFGRPESLPARHKPKPVPAANSDDPDSLVAQMLAQGRYSLLLRPQVTEDLEQHQFEQALEVLQTNMALVPDGTVILGEADERENEQATDQSRWPQQRAIRVAPYFLDRYPITNRQYYEFVESGGYEQITYWDTAIWPAVLDFVDQTQQPGPRFWLDGYCDPGEDEHPVVGISWYEAAAYARWAGKRLPTDAEWVKAGAWPVKLSETQSSQRQFPWGDTMDRNKANLWGTGPGKTTPSGSSMRGSVWEASIN